LNWKKRVSGTTLFLLLLLSAGCGAVKKKTVVTVPPAYAQAKAATLEELIFLVNDDYARIASLTVPRFEVEFTGGSIEDGYFEEYRKAKGYLVAEEPDSIFVNILNPLTSSSVLVMASRRKRFQIWIPSRNQYVTGRTDVETDEENAVYQVRPTHILQGMLIEPVETGSLGPKYYVEEDQDGRFKYYVLVLLEADDRSPVLRLVRKIWIERSRMQVVRQQYFEDSRMVSDIRYGESVQMDGSLVPDEVHINRPVDGYSISFDVDTKGVTLNRQMKPDAFELDQPPGSELIVVGE
jgi:hypothetical protein